MIHIVLVEPEIPQNTGNIARTCAVTGAHLHLIEPLGFDISERAVRRAGLDYWPMVNLSVYRDLEHFFSVNGDEHLWLTTTKAPRMYTDAAFEEDCFLLFGKETAGLDPALRARYRERCIRIPMRAGARSMNLANAVAVVCFEALRQRNFAGLIGTGEMALEG